MRPSLTLAVWPLSEIYVILWIERHKAAISSTFAKRGPHENKKAEAGLATYCRGHRTSSHSVAFPVRCSWQSLTCFQNFPTQTKEVASFPLGVSSTDSSLVTLYKSADRELHILTWFIHG